MEQSTQSTSFSFHSGMTLKEFKQELIDYGRTCIPAELRHLIRIPGSSESKNMYLMNTETQETLDLLKRRFGRDSIRTQIANNVDIESLEPLLAFEFDVSDNSKTIAELLPNRDETMLLIVEKRKVKNNIQAAISDVKTSIYKLIEASKNESNKESQSQEAKTFRLSQAARKLNVGTQYILDFLREQGVRIESSPNSKITLEQYDQLAKYFNATRAVKENTPSDSNKDSSVSNKIGIEQLKTNPITLNQRAFFVGGFDWDGEKKRTIFLKEGIWQNGWEDKFQNVVDSAQVGDIIFLKSTARKKEGGFLRLHAVGVILENQKGNGVLKVNWSEFNEEIELKRGAHLRNAIQKIGEDFVDDILLAVLDQYPDLPVIIEDLWNSRVSININLLTVQTKIKINELSGSSFWWASDYKHNWSNKEIYKDTTYLFPNDEPNELHPENGELLIVASNPAKDQRLVGIFEIIGMKGSEVEASLLYELNNKVLTNELNKNKLLTIWGISDILMRDVTQIPADIFNKIINFTELANLSSSKTEKDPVKPTTESTKDKIPFHNDVVAQEDKLGREPVAKAFVDLIKKDVFTEDMNHAFMVHLQGEWGAGKSTFLNLIKKHLNDENEEWIVIDYNAWQNQHITPPWWTLIDQIYRQTKIRKPFDFFGNLWRGENWRRIKLYSGWQKTIAIFLTLIIVSGLVYFGKSIIDFVLGIPFFAVGKDSAENEPIIATIGKLLVALGSIITIIFAFSKVLTSSFFTISSDEANSFLKRSADPMSRIKTHFGGLVNDINSKEKTRWWSKSNKKKRQLAIFIDDIDRCNRGFIIQLLEGIQTLFKEKKVLYIVAGDKNWITTSFANTYKEFNNPQSSSHHNLGELFLEKAFQMSLRMPNISDASKEEYWSHILGITEVQSEKRVETEEISPELKKEVQQELDSTEEDITSPEFIEKFEKKHNFSSNAASNFIIEKKNESDKEIRHLLKDLHGLVETNPRSIIRLANNYTMTRSTLIAERKSFNAEKLLRWLILKDLYPTVIDSVRSNKTMEEIKEELTEPSVREKYDKLLTGSKEDETDILSIQEIKQFEGI